MTTRQLSDAELIAAAKVEFAAEQNPPAECEGCSDHVPPVGVAGGCFCCELCLISAFEHGRKHVPESFEVEDGE